MNAPCRLVSTQLREFRHKCPEAHSLGGSAPQTPRYQSASGLWHAPGLWPGAVAQQIEVFQEAKQRRLAKKQNIAKQSKAKTNKAKQSKANHMKQNTFLCKSTSGQSGCVAPATTLTQVIRPLRRLCTRALTRSAKSGVKRRCQLSSDSEEEDEKPHKRTRQGATPEQLLCSVVERMTSKFTSHIEKLELSESKAKQIT